MKKSIDLLLLVVLILLSLATGITKVVQMPAEMELFYYSGFTTWMIVVFGILQILGGLLLISSNYRKYGALIMLLSFIIATVVVFYKGMMAFGFASMIFIALAAYQWKINA